MVHFDARILAAVAHSDLDHASTPSSNPEPPEVSP